MGFPVDPETRPWRVVETAQGRTLMPPEANGPTLREAVERYQVKPENDMETNRFGWDCRLHNQYEGAPAVDWYLAEGTPVHATMDGTAELRIITPLNSFDFYGIDKSLYLGLPRPDLPLYPFSGPSGGMGVFVSIVNGNLRAEFGHLNLERTLAAVPATAFVSPYGPTYAYATSFAKPLNPGEETVVARWPVKRGDTVGYVGNTGYSDVPHLHYQIRPRDDRSTKYCPTTERFPFSGWLFQAPEPLP